HYKDYCGWLKREDVVRSIKKQEEFWTNEFRDEIPLLELPFDYPRNSHRVFSGDTYAFAIDPGLTELIKKQAARSEVTLMMFLFSVYNIFLSKCTAQERLVTGSLAAGRMHADTADIIGFFVNILAVKTFPARDKTFNRYLAEVKEKALNAYDNQLYPFEELVGKLKLKRETGRHPLVDTLFTFQDEIRIGPADNDTNANGA
ncbi:MAG: hypothetical protein GY940_03585, partial [bacterium]|nr:hypothetical protein [bacterium]